jgi:hypothetical protein
MAVALYARHSSGLAAVYADMENSALNQDQPLVGTPGSISIRENAGGSRFYVRQYYDYDGRKTDQYLGGPVGDPGADARAEEWKTRIAEAKDIVTSVRLLGREGYALLSPKHVAALAPLWKYKLFQAGALLVGTHAFEVIVNRLGIRVPVFQTEDVDIARPTKLAVEALPKGGLLELLRESQIDFVDVSGLRPGAPTAKYKEKRRSQFTFDLLMPASGDEPEIHPVPELGAHATALPYFRYLLTESQMGAALSNHGVVGVRVPVPERFALHKLIVSQLRIGRPAKSLKDLDQAAALIAALGENHPGAIEAAYAKTTVSARKHIRRSLMQIRAKLDPHPRAWEEVAAVAKLDRADRGQTPIPGPRDRLRGQPK